MQKRLLALVATVAMVLSMFASVAFAATGPVSDRYYDLQWGSPTFSAISAKDNVINYYADFSLVPETTNPADVTAKWVGIGIKAPNIFGVEIAGYHYTLTRENGDVETGYSAIDTFADSVKGLEWGLNTNLYRTAKITVKWLNQHGQQVGFDETFVFNFVDTRLQQVSYPYVGTDGIYADFQVLENGVPADLENYSFSVNDGTAQAGKKGETVAKVMLGAVDGTGKVRVTVLRKVSTDPVASLAVSELEDVSLELSALPYRVQGLPESIPAGAETTLTPAFYYLDAGQAKAATSFDITYEGAGLEETEKKGVTFVIVEPTETGTLVLKITAKATVDGETVTVGTDTVELKVTGYNMTIEPKTVLVDTAGSITIVLTDEDGNPINNADIEIASTEFANLSLKPNNGVYVIDYKKDAAFITSAGEKTVTATIPTGDSENPEVTVTGTLLVLGDEVYTVTSNLTKDILAGQKTQLTLQVKDGDKAVIPAKVKVLNAKGEQVGSDIAPLRSGDNVVVTLPIFAKAGEYTIVVENSDAKKIGKLLVNVQLPVLKLSAEKVTNNVVSEFTVELLDPTNDNAPLQWLLKVAPDHATIHSLKLADKAVFGSSSYYLGRLEKYELSVLLTADYDAAEEAEEVAGLIFTATGDADVEFDVVSIADAELIADPATMSIGQKGTLTLTLVDANGAPLADYTVLHGDAEFTTDEDGVVEYQVTRMNSNLTFVANLDAKTGTPAEPLTVSTTVKMTDDILAPTVTYEEEVNTNKTTIVIADNVRLARVRINGEEIDLFGRNPYEHKVTLVAGPNEFHIEALDAEGNLFDDVIEINYVSSSIVLEGDKVQRQGEYLFVQLRQFEELGAEFAWNQEAKVATFVVGDTKVEVTIGSTTAKVNGEAVTMPVAAFIDAALGRTYVPVRFVSEALGWNVHWAAGDIVTITLK